MKEGQFMQLLLLIMLALAGGNAEALKQVKPVIEKLGGGDAMNMIKEAEELSKMLSAVQSLTGGAKSAGSPSFNKGCSNGANAEFAQHGFPLAPIAQIADENITYCLSRYISLGG